MTMSNCTKFYEWKTESTDGRKVIQEWANECIIGIDEGIRM